MFSSPSKQITQCAREIDSEDRSSPAQRHVLFVTAPFGPFSRTLAGELRARGARASRIILNAGELVDWGLTDARQFRGRPKQFGAWVDNYITRESVTDLVIHGGRSLFGQVAVRAARGRGARVHVFEEGYFRPHWITLERDGVNADSPLPRDADYFRRTAAAIKEPDFTPLGKITPAAVARITAFHIWQGLGKPLFPRYRHGYRDLPLKQALGHTRRYFSQLANRRRWEAKERELLATRAPMFLALMQRPGDFQLLRTNGLRDAADFIRHVIGDFARQAPPDAVLAFKCHPLDPGLDPHERSVMETAQAMAVADRVHFLDGGRLPGLIRASAGVLSVNSSGGLLAIEHNKPTLVLGEAIYDFEGLTHQGDLASFWTAPQAPDPALANAFRRVVLHHTQINGDFSTLAGIRMAAPTAAERILA